MLKYASLAAAVAARNYQCADRKQWADCVLAYANGECGSNIGECDRTCGRCQTAEDICYDMVPPGHYMFFDDGQPVRSEWPNASNNGGNSLPRKLEEDTDSYFPFDPANVSQFCLDVFEGKMCDNNDLQLTYEWESSGEVNQKTITLAGKAYEYCRFSCGYCKQNNDCYTNHNEGMKFLSRPVEEFADARLGTFNFEDIWDSGDDSWGASFDDASEDDGGWGDDEWGAVDDDAEAETWGAIENTWGASDWDWRKRRALSGSVPKAEILKSAVQNIVSHLEHGMDLNPKMRAILSRKRRQSWMAGQSNTQQYEERKQYSDMIKTCWITALNDEMESGEEVEEEEEEIAEGGEEEEDGNFISQITERRAELDNIGIKNYFANLNNDASLGACSYKAMPYGEPDMYMPLHYVCGLSCDEGEAPFAYNSISESADVIEFNEESNMFEYNMECERKHKGMKPKEPSDCGSMEYPNLRIICQEVQAEEEAEEVAYEAEEETELEDALADYYNYNFGFMTMG